MTDGRAAAGTPRASPVRSAVAAAAANASSSTDAASSSSSSTPSSPFSMRLKRRLIFALAAAAGVFLGVAIIVVQSGGTLRPTIMYGVLSAKHGSVMPPPRPPLLTDMDNFEPEKLRFLWVPAGVQEQVEKEVDSSKAKEQQAPAVAAAAEEEVQGAAGGGEPMLVEKKNNNKGEVEDRGAGVASCDLIVEGHDWASFDDPKAAHACLRNKSIVLIGDSLTRYQYLNLVNFVENGKWWNHDPQLECEFQWQGWPDFYQGTNARFNGREVCDCYREEPAGRRGNIENRFYYNEEADVWISFFQWFNVDCGHLGHDLEWLGVPLPPPRTKRWDARRRRPRGSSNNKQHTEEEQQQQQQQQQKQKLRGPRLSPETLQALTATQRRRQQSGCLPGHCNETLHWSHDIYGLFEEVVPQLHPDYLIFNSGHWGRLGIETSPYDLTRLSQAAREAVRASGGRAIYKTTTSPREGAPFIPEDDLKAFFLQEGISVLDAGAITFGARAMDVHFGEKEDRHLFFDMLHFFSPVYAGLNRVMLNYMCPASAGGGGDSG